MPHYQQLLFGCTNPRAGLTDRNPMNEIELIWNWIEHLTEATRITLDWPADTVLIQPLSSDQSDGDDVLGVVAAISHPEVRRHTRTPAWLGALPREVGSIELAELCLSLSEDIRTAMMQWEIARFSARGIGLDLPAGRLFLVEGWFDAEEDTTT
jgi:hypothetical protein